MRRSQSIEAEREVWRIGGGVERFGSQGQPKTSGGEIDLRRKIPVGVASRDRSEEEES